MQPNKLYLMSDEREDSMQTLLTILWYVGAVLVSIALFLCLLLAMLIIALRHQVEKFMFGMPWLKWLTLEDLREFRLSRRWARFILPVFHENGYLEVRLIDKDAMETWDHDIVDQFGFTVMTVHLYEFKLTKRKGRKDKWSFSARDLVPAWKPARA